MKCIERGSPASIAAILGLLVQRSQNFLLEAAEASEQMHRCGSEEMSRERKSSSSPPYSDCRSEIVLSHPIGAYSDFGETFSCIKVSSSHMSEEKRWKLSNLSYRSLSLSKRSQNFLLQATKTSTHKHRCRSAETCHDQNSSCALTTKCRSAILLSHPFDSGEICVYDEEPTLPPNDENRREPNVKPVRQPSIVLKMRRSRSEVHFGLALTTWCLDSPNLMSPGEMNASTANCDDDDDDDDEVDSVFSLETSKRRIGGSVPNDGLRIRIATTSDMDETEELIQDRLTSSSGKPSFLSRLFRRKNVFKPGNVKRRANVLPSGESNTDDSVVVHHGLVRRQLYNFRLSVGASAKNLETRSRSTSPCSLGVMDGVSGKPRDGSECPSKTTDPTLTINLSRVLKLKNYMTNRWITGMAVTEKGDLALVDLREAYLVDAAGNLIRKIGPRNSSHPLLEPFRVASGIKDRLVFTDHYDQTLKVFSSTGTHLDSVEHFQKSNLCDIAVGPPSGRHHSDTIGDIYFADTTQKIILMYVDEKVSVFSPRGPRGKQVFKYPTCVAINPISSEVIVGDSTVQSLFAMTMTGEESWIFKHESGPDERRFYPSAISVDAQAGLIFVSDLYNDRIFLLSSAGILLQLLLSLGSGLDGHPTATAVDGRGNLFVADEERTVKVFGYSRYVDVDVSHNLDDIAETMKHRRTSTDSMADP